MQAPTVHLLRGVHSPVQETQLPSKTLTPSASITVTRTGIPKLTLDETVQKSLNCLNTLSRYSNLAAETPSFSSTNIPITLRWFSGFLPTSQLAVVWIGSGDCLNFLRENSNESERQHRLRNLIKATFSQNTDYFSIATTVLKRP